MATIRLFTATTTWQCPTWVTSINVECIGCGGAGGGRTSAGQAGGGGGGALRASTTNRAGGVGKQGLMIITYSPGASPFPVALSS